MDKQDKKVEYKAETKPTSLKIILAAFAAAGFIILTFTISAWKIFGGINLAVGTLSTLPAPEVSEGERGELGIDKNINETTIDNYLGRSDTVYRDMRMLVDPANYAAIGGDSYLTGIVNGYEVVPYPYLAPVEGLPEAVGAPYSGPALFSKDENGNYVANYEESMTALEELFPKDKNIFLMCGGGGYARDTKALLVSLGWDENKIYNTGSFWSYRGDNVTTFKAELNGETIYEFWNVPYHDIDFPTLHVKKN